METPIARIARWFAHRNDAPTECGYCRVELAADEGVWRRTEQERTCGSDACEAQSAALQSW